MPVFAYEPNKFNAWLERMNNCITGADNDTVQTCTTKFKSTMEKLLNDNVWTGPSAVKNFNDFKLAYESFKNFSNSFSSSFNEYMKAVAADLNELEYTNSISTMQGILAPELDAARVDTVLTEFNKSDNVVYDYAQITEIKSELSSIINVIPSLKERMKTVINELDSGNRMYDGNKAASIRDSLNSMVQTGLEKVESILNVCASNIQQAAENAAAADR